jgi:hypothetical protein
MEMYETIKSRPSFVPLPRPKHTDNAKHNCDGKNKEVPFVEYLPYDEVKNRPSNPQFLPSYERPKTAPALSKDIDRRRAKDMPLELREKKKGSKSAISLWHAHNVRTLVQCQNCDRVRCVYAWPIITEDFRRPVEMLQAILESPTYDYECGDELLGEPGDSYTECSTVTIFMVKRGLTCAMPTETHYYSSSTRTKFPAMCFHCCSYNNLVAEDVVRQKTNGKTPLPICKDCWDGNKIPGTTGKSIKTSYKSKRTRGSAHTTPSPAKIAKVQSPPSDATTPPSPTDYVGMKKIVDFASAVARGLDNEKHAITERVHGESQSLNAKTHNPVPTIDRKGQQRIIDFWSGVPPNKKEKNKKTISHSKHLNCPDGGYIIPLGEPLNQTQRLQLYRAVGMDQDCIDNDFELVNVSPNGNCALLVVQQFLHSTGREKTMTITQFRLMLFEYLNDNKETFQTVSQAFPFAWMYQNNQWDIIVSALYQPGTNFEKGCSSSYWVDVLAIGTILAHKYHITLNVYGEQKITVQYLEGLGLKSEHALAPTLMEAPHTLFCLFHKFHYYWIKPRK